MQDERVGKLSILRKWRHLIIALVILFTSVGLPANMILAASEEETQNPAIITIGRGPRPFGRISSWMRNLFRPMVQCPVSLARGKLTVITV